MFIWCPLFDSAFFDELPPEMLLVDFDLLNKLPNMLPRVFDLPPERSLTATLLPLDVRGECLPIVATDNVEGVPAVRGDSASKDFTPTVL